jgi:hypothetical protein
MNKYYAAAADAERAAKVGLDVSSLVDRYLAQGDITPNQAAELKRNHLPPTVLSYKESTMTFSPLSAFPKRDYLLKRLRIEKNSLVALVAQGGSGKTMLIQYLNLCVDRGLPLFGQFPVTQGKVLHIDQEQSESQTALRYSRLANGLGVNDFSITRHYITNKLDADPTIMDKVQAELVDIFRDYDLVIIDSLKKISAADENSSDIERVLNLLKRVSELASCAIILIHHKGKKDSGARQSGRGHSSIYDSVDVQIDLDHEPGQDSYQLTCTKNRNGSPFDGISYSLKDTGFFVDDQDCTQALTMECLSAHTVSREEECRLKILTHLSTHAELNNSGLFSLVKGERRAFDAAISYLTANKLILERRGASNARLFSITDPGRQHLAYTGAV